jgi:hypothetical protein
LQDKDFDALLEDLPEDLPNDLPKDGLDEVFDADAFSSYSHLSVRHSEMSWPLHLQWVHFFLLSCFFFALPELLAKYAITSPPAAHMHLLSSAKICEIMSLLVCLPPPVFARTILSMF